MAFWSRNKNKKDTPATTATSSSPTTAATNTPLANGTIPSSSSSASSPAGRAPLPPSQLSAYSSSRTNGINNNNSSSSQSLTPPHSPSSIIASTSPWSMRKIRGINPYPRFGQATNITASREGEIFIFGGLVKDRRKNDVFWIEYGIHRSKKGG